MFQTKNTLLGKAKAFIIVFLTYHFLTINSHSENPTQTENFAVLTILDKVNFQISRICMLQITRRKIRSQMLIYFDGKY